MAVTIAAAKRRILFAFIFLSFAKMMDGAPAAPVENIENDEENNTDDVDEDAIDPTVVRSKRQINNYNDYYYYGNGVSNSNSYCPFRNLFNSFGIGLNNNVYRSGSGFGSSSGYGSFNNYGSFNGRSSGRRLLRNRQPLLYNGRRGLYAPFRYFSSTSNSRLV